MNKKIFTKASAAALMLFTAAQPAAAADIAITVNGSPLAADVPPTVINSRVMLPLRACAEALNAAVNYDAATGQIDVFAGADKIELMLNSAVATVNGQAAQMDVEPQIVNSRTLVPLRFLGEALNAQVEWQAQTNTVAITAAVSANTEPAEIPSMATVANQALQQINSVRLQKGLNSLVSATELSDMAAAHSQSMCAADLLANKLPGGKSLNSRAEQQGIATPNELIACIDYSRENVYQAVSAWFTAEPARSMLLDASAGYIGIAASRDENSSTVYLTAEVMPYRAYFIGLPLNSTTADAALAVRGRTSRLSQDVIVYRIAPDNAHMYTDKTTQTLSGDGSYFSTTLKFDNPGTYVIEADGCMVRVTYKP